MTTVCPRCEKAMAEESYSGKCPACGYSQVFEVEEQDRLLKKGTLNVKKKRKEMGLDSILHGVVGLVIRVESGTLESSVGELVSTTSLEHVDSFVHNGFSNAILEAKRTPTFIVRDGKETNPFMEFNDAPRTAGKPDTRLETFIFETSDMEHLMESHKTADIPFPEEVLRWHGSCYARLKPSKNTHNSIGYVHFDGERSFKPDGAEEGIPLVQKPDRDHIHNVGFLDHSATRLTHLDRTPAILELMMLTGYDFTEAIYVKSFNSITNVTRLHEKDFSMVLTSGIKPYTGKPDVSEPTEKFVRNYGKRVHHLAWQADPIEDVYSGMKEDGMEFLLDLVGGPEESLKQTFSKPSPNTFLVTEYIHRYGDFDGFFTKSNVTKLTEATDWQ